MARARQNRENHYKITMPLYFSKTYADLKDVEKERYEDAVQFCRKVQVFREMEERYPTKESIEAYIKTFRPAEFVECLVNCEEYDAEWSPDRFEISFKVKTHESLAEIKSGLSFISLADAQWESSDSNGWTIKTDPPGGNNNSGNYGYEYGLTHINHRETRVEVVPEPAAVPVPEPEPMPVALSVPQHQRPLTPLPVFTNESNNSSNNESNTASPVAIKNTEYVYSNTENYNFRENNENRRGGKRKKRKTRRSKKALKRTRKNRK